MKKTLSGFAPSITIIYNDRCIKLFSIRLSRFTGKTLVLFWLIAVMALNSYAGTPGESGSFKTGSMLKGNGPNTAIANTKAVGASNKAQLFDGNGLSSLTISSGTLSPVFATGTTSYSATVANSVNAITITVAAGTSYFGIEIEGGNGSNTFLEGSGSYTQPLTEGEPYNGVNVITITVEDDSPAGETQYTLTVTRQQGAPTVSATAAATNITVNSATLGYTESDDGGLFPSDQGVVYGTSPNPTVFGINNTTFFGYDVGTFSTNVTGLSANTTYYVRGYATNNLGVSYGPQISFETIDNPPVITATTAILNYFAGSAAINIAPNATITAGSSQIQSVYINGAIVGDVLSMPAAGGLIGTFSGTGLTISGTGTAAQYQAALQSVTFQNNGTETGSRDFFVQAYDGVITTTPVALDDITVRILPALTTSAAAAVGQTTVSLGYTITNPSFAPITEQGVVFSSTDATPTTADGKAQSSFSPFTLQFLSPGVTYYARAYAICLGATIYGNIISFTTLTVGVSTPAATSILQNSASLGYTITNPGNVYVNDEGVVWSTTNTTPTVVDTKVEFFANPSTVSLYYANTTYYVRAYATVNGITVYGNTISFTTLADAAPTVNTTAAANITTTSATLGNNITAIGGVYVSDYGAVYSTTHTSPTLSDTKLAFGTIEENTGTYSGTATGLNPNTTYYVAAYATNPTGTSYGSPVSFTTGSANLSGIGVSAGTLSPVFSATTTGYTLSVGNTVSSLTITPSSAYPNAVITVNGAALTSGAASVNLNVGSNTITIFVTADGSLTNTYTLTVTRAVSSDASLAGLSTSPGTLSPLFTAGTTVYTDTVSNTVTLAVVTAVTNNASATVAMVINGNEFSSGATATVSINPGINTIAITVTAQDGVTQSAYNLTIFKQAALPTLTTTQPSNISSTSAFFGYHVISTGGAALTDQGIVYSSTDANPTTADTKIQFGNQTGTFLRIESGLQAGTTYYAAAYATNSTGTAYGSTASFTTLNTINSITAASANPTNAASVNYTVTFAGNVTGLSASNFTLSPTGYISGAFVSNISGSGSVYTVTVNTGTGSGTLTLNLANGAGLSPGVSTALPFAGETYTIPDIPPAVTSYTVTSSNANPLLAYPGDVITFTFTTNEPVTAFGLVEDYPQGASQVSNNTYSVSYTMKGTDPSGPIPVEADLTDQAYSYSAFTETTNIIFNPQSPVAISGLTVPGLYAPTNAASLNYTLSLSSEIDNLSAANFTLTTTGTIAGAGINSVVQNPDNTYTINVNTGTGDGNLTLNLDNATGLSTAITTSLPFSGSTYTIQKSLPSVTSFSVTSSNANPLLAYPGDVITFTFTTSEAVTAFGLVEDYPQGASQVSNNTYSVSYTMQSTDPAGPIPVEADLTDPAYNYFAFTNTSAIVFYPLVPSISASGTLPALSTGQNTASASAPFSISGTNLSAGVLVTPPTGFEVSTDNSSFSNTVTVAASGQLLSVPVYIRLAATDAAGTYSGNIVLSSGGATSVNVSIPLSTVVSSDARLSNLTLNAGLLTPSFSSGTTSYTRNLVNGVQAVTIVPTTDGAGATIVINGTESIVSGTRSNPIPVSVGSNTITIQVTAADGVTTQTYTLTLIKNGTKNDLLTSLKLSKGVLSPVFAGTNGSYTASVANAVSSLSITPVTSDPNATVTINGKPATPGTAFGPIALVPGPNVITTTVTAQNDTATRTYTITVTRAAATNDNLVSLKPSRGALSPAFATLTANYSASVVSGVSSMTVTPTAADPDAAILVNGTDAVTSGTASGPIALAVGPNIITVKVTAGDGITNKTYTLTVTRAAASADGYVPIAIGTGASVTNPMVIATLADDGIVVHQAISPNGDGINDFLQIDNISQFPDNKLSIINRNGQLIYQTAGYNNSSKVFDGHSNKNGQMQLPGTYFYQLDYTVKGITKTKTGFLVLKY